MDKLLKIILVIAASSTSVYLLILGVFASPSADDFGFIAMVNNEGVWELVKTMYLTWQPRYSCFFVNGIIFKLFGYADSLWLYTIIQLIIGYISVYLLWSRITKIENKSLSVVISILLTNIGLMSLLEISTLYWLCTANYIHEIWATFLLFYFLFFCSHRMAQYIGTILCSIYLGGCAENYTPLVIISLLMIVFIRVSKDKLSYLITDKSNLLISCSVIVLLIGFMIVFYGPGNKARILETGARGCMNDFNMLMFIKTSLHATIIFSLRLLSKVWYYLCIIGISIIIGTKYFNRQISSKFMICITCVLVMIVYLSVAIGVFGTGWYVAPRAYSYMSFVLAAYFCVVGIFIGQRFKKISFVGGGLCVAITITSICYIYNELPVIKQYHDEVKCIKHQLLYLAENDFRETYRVKKIETPQWINSYSYLRNGMDFLLNRPAQFYEKYFPYEPFVVTKDTNNWRNRGIIEWCGGNFVLVGWENI